MSRFKLSVLFLITFIFTNKSFGEDPTLTKYKEAFQKGVLTDHTPVEISNRSGDLESAGPFLILAGIDREGHLLDIRPETDREKINFTLKNGKGGFAPFNSPDQKQEQKLSAIPDSEGVVEVLFYPDSSAHQNDYKVDVSMSGGKGITGSLSYHFRFAALESGKFQKVCEKNIEIQNKILSSPRSEKTTSVITKYDRTGTGVIGKEVKATFFTSDGDGNTVLRENDKNGKVLLKRKNNIKGTIDNSICSFAKMWGSTPSDYIFLNTPQPKGDGTNVLTFLFCDKTNSVIDKTITVSTSGLMVDGSVFDFTVYPPISKSGRIVEMHLWGGKKEVMESTHTLEH